MKRPVLVTMLLLAGVAAAQADTSSWTAIHPPRSDSELFAAGRYCDARFGPDTNGVPLSAAYKSCMRSQGWIFRSRVTDDTWVNHRGMRCHPILGGAGSTCDSVW